MARHFLATGGRDKICALLALTSDGSELIPTSYYCASTTEDKVIFELFEKSISRALLYWCLRKMKPNKEMGYILASDSGAGVDGILERGNIACLFPSWIARHLRSREMDGFYEDHGTNIARCFES